MYPSNRVRTANPVSVRVKVMVSASLSSAAVESPVLIESQNFKQVDPRTSEPSDNWAGTHYIYGHRHLVGAHCVSICNQCMEFCLLCSGYELGQRFFS